jgi:leucyl aminopeptidase
VHPVLGTNIGIVSTTISKAPTTVTAVSASPLSLDVDAIVIGVVEGEDGPRLAQGAAEIADALGGELPRTLAVLGATGKAEEVTKLPSGGRIRAPLIVAAGLGRETSPQDSFRGREAVRRAAGAAVRALAAGAANRDKWRIGFALPVSDSADAADVALGALLGSYEFGRYRAQRHAPVAELVVLSGDAAAAAEIERVRVIADAVWLVRDLVNTAPGDLTPPDLAAEAQRVAEGCGLGVEVLGVEELTEHGYGGILGVGQGSVNPPRLVRLEYSPPGAERTVVFAGKGITFDSGGLSLKPAASMEIMKSDMGGAAAVLAAMQAIAALRPAVRVVGYLPLAENMPSGTAQRPSDVLTIYGGTTVEVLNTDAEGRLVLADVLARSADDGPTLLVDVATLTGSQLIALGDRISAVMASDDAVREAVVDAARRGGEAMWPMPLPSELRKSLDSTVADIANVAPDKMAGMLVAGTFLREFVPSGVRWAHIDIAGPSFNEGDAYGYTPKGGTGAATRTLIQIAEDVADGLL